MSASAPNQEESKVGSGRKCCEDSYNQAWSFFLLTFDIKPWNPDRSAGWASAQLVLPFATSSLAYKFFSYLAGMSPYIFTENKEKTLQVSYDRDTHTIEYMN